MTITVSRMYQLEQRLCRILIAALLLSWLSGFFVVNSLFTVWIENYMLQKRVASAEWLANDQRLAVKACYQSKLLRWRDSLASLDDEPVEN